jgi:DMSO reductase anchor subunit
VYAWRALRGLRQSWLSREVLTLSLFAGAASAYAGMLFLDLPVRYAVGLATVVFGVAGVTSSARIYVVKARPAWYSMFTVTEFFATALLLGPLFARAMGHDATWTVWAAVAGGLAQLATQALKFAWLAQSETFELRASGLLLSGRLRAWMLARLAVLVAVSVAAPLFSQQAACVAILALALAGEWLGRWLFFVSVVPKNIAAAFSTKVAA